MTIKMKLPKDIVPKVLEISAINFPVPGVDMVDFQGGVRAFIASRQHQLWRNAIDNQGNFLWPLRTGRYDRYLSAVYGSVHIIAARSVGVMHNLKEHKVSIQDGVLQTEPTGNIREMYLLDEPLGLQAELDYSVPHTIYVPPQTTAAWFIVINAEDKQGEELAYTNLDLATEGIHFEPMPEDILLDHLKTLRIDIKDVA